MKTGPDGPASFSVVCRHGNVEVVARFLGPAAIEAGPAALLYVLHESLRDVAVVGHVVPVPKITRQQCRHDTGLAPRSYGECERLALGRLRFIAHM